MWISLIIVNTIKAQIAYYDAISLKELQKGLNGNLEYCLLPKTDNVFNILAKYFDIEPNLETSNRYIYEAFKDNPYIKFDTAHYKAPGRSGDILDNYVEPESKIQLKNIGGIDISTLVQGLSQFMINRAKSELNVAFFDKFKEYTEENDEIKLLFPITTKRLSYLISYQYCEMISQLRSAFYEDLNNLPDNIISFLRNSNDFIELRRTKPEFTLFINSLELIRKFEYLSPSEIIEQLPTITEKILDNAEDGNEYQKINNLNTALELAYIFSNAIRDTSKNRNWIDSKALYNNILKDNVTKNIFLGLIFQQIMTKNLKINGRVLADTIISLKKHKIDWYDEQIRKFDYLTSKIDFSYAEFIKIKTNGDKVRQDQLYSYINTSIEVFEFGNQFVEKIGGLSSDKYLIISRNAVDIYRYTYQKEYSSAILSTFEFFKRIVQYQSINDSLTMDKFSKGIIISNRIDSIILADSIKEVFDFVSLPQTKHFVRLSNEIIKFNTTLLKYNEDYKGERIAYKKANSAQKETLLKQWHNELAEKIQNDARQFVIRKIKNSGWEDDLVKYGTFMANIVKAETPEDVRNVLETTVLPVGSSSIKKNSNLNISINGYIGGYYRFGSVDNAKTAWKSRWAVTAPVGLAFSYGLKKGGSISLTGVLLDVGAVVDYKLTNDSTYIESKITLGNIFSPGAYVVYGMAWNLPVSIGIGAQYGPGLSSINSKENITINKPDWRYGIMITVDIPFFNLYNSPKRN
jgi:hypothetical protein